MSQAPHAPSESDTDGVHRSTRFDVGGRSAEGMRRLFGLIKAGLTACAVGRCVRGRPRGLVTCRTQLRGTACTGHAAWADGDVVGLSVPHWFRAGLIVVDEDGHVRQPKTGPPLFHVSSCHCHISSPCAGKCVITIGVSVPTASSNIGTKVGSRAHIGDADLWLSP